MSETKQVLVDEKKSSRILILNRPKQLNALSFEMISFMLDRFLVFEKDPSVKFVILKGNGKAFCAGGDVASVIRAIRKGSWRVGAQFFRQELTLMYLLATAKKPQVSFLNGIVMGAGAGVSIHGQFRVATEKSVFAMPENALGHFPDVGSSYFLSRLPGFFGEYAGLTGSRMDGAEMLACGLATHFVPSEEKEADRNKDEYEWILSIIQSLQKASPMSLKISLRSIREGRLEGIGKCLVREYRIDCHAIKCEISNDAFEGCRAILLDKDKNPKWSPATLEQVSDEMVDKYFSKVDDEDWEDLKLPSRSNLPPFAIAKL